MVIIVTALQTRWLTRPRSERDLRSERGQATAEYALVLLAAAAVALVLIVWATRSGKISELFDAVFDSLVKKVR